MGCRQPESSHAGNANQPRCRDDRAFPRSSQAPAALVDVCRVSGECVCETNLPGVVGVTTCVGQRFLKSATIRLGAVGRTRPGSLRLNVDPTMPWDPDWPGQSPSRAGRRCGKASMVVIVNSVPGARVPNVHKRSHRVHVLAQTAISSLLVIVSERQALPDKATASGRVRDGINRNRPRSRPVSARQTYEFKAALPSNILAIPLFHAESRRMTDGQSRAYVGACVALFNAASILATWCARIRVYGRQIHSVAQC